MIILYLDPWTDSLIISFFIAAITWVLLLNNRIKSKIRKFFHWIFGKCYAQLLKLQQRTFNIISDSHLVPPEIIGLNYMRHLFGILFKVSYLKTLYLNFRYLPYKQAIKFPIILAHGVRFFNFNGKISINPITIKFGMIRIGFETYKFQTGSNKTIIESHGGTIFFEGISTIGKGTYMLIGKSGNIVIGDNVLLGRVKIICYSKINIGKNTRIAWDTTIIDTDFHQTINIITQERSIPNKPITLGNNNWIGFETTILKGTITPNFCTVGAKSLLNKVYPVNDYSFLAGHPAKLVKEGAYRDLNSFVD